MIRRCAVLLVAMLFASAAGAQAQDNAGDALYKILFGSNGQGALDFDVVAAIGVILPGEATTFPLASSSGGFTWTFDPALGVQTRRSQSFGPMFAERPFTNGRRKFNVGIAYQHTGFDSLAGQPLSALKTVDRPTQVGAGNVGIERTYSSDLKYAVNSTIISASYGVTDRIDVGVLIPIDRATASGSSRSTVTALNVPANRCVTVTNANTRATSQLCAPVSAAADLSISEGLCLQALNGRFWCPSSENNVNGVSTGLGDMIVRGKFSIISTPMMDLGAGVDLRNPTGDVDKFLGLGKPQLKAMVMGSKTFGMLAPHFNVGYTFSGKGLAFNSDGSLDFDAIYDDNGHVISEPSDEVNYVFGVDFAATQSVTVMGDVVGRSLKNAANFEFTTQGQSSGFTVTSGTLNLVLGTIGTKIKIGNEFLFTASVVFPLNSAGIKPGVTPVIGFERAF